jgi:hypothetical protein
MCSSIDFFPNTFRSTRNTSSTWFEISQHSLDYQVNGKIRLISSTESANFPRKFPDYISKIKFDFGKKGAFEIKKRKTYSVDKILDGVVQITMLMIERDNHRITSISFQIEQRFFELNVVHVGLPDWILLDFCISCVFHI